jgi:hypothetical protein
MTDRYESRASTHADVCWSWGPGHYKCAVAEIERLREMLQSAFQRGYQSGARGLREMYDAVQAVKRQDAWGNTRLTEALIEAEERAERAEAENKRLRAEVERLNRQQDKPDAARWRYIRRKLCLTGNGDGTCAMQAINLPAAIQGWPEPGQVAEFCDAAIDAALSKENKA